nr:1603_t:CDS:2 [Entrophospora candida]
MRINDAQNHTENKNISTEETINGNDMEEIQPNEENTLTNNNQITTESKLLEIRYVENILNDTKNLIGIKCAFKYEKKTDPRHCNEWAERSIRISDIPLDIRKQVLKEILEQYGEIERLALCLSGRWYVAIATYKKN